MMVGVQSGKKIYIKGTVRAKRTTKHRILKKKTTAALWRLTCHCLGQRPRLWYLQWAENEARCGPWGQLGSAYYFPVPDTCLYPESTHKNTQTHTLIHVHIWFLKILENTKSFKGQELFHACIKWTVYIYIYVYNIVRKDVCARVSLAFKGL